ncbi:hypothetical protein Trydic_g873 [Trypoxylus dichotomus]
MQRFAKLFPNKCSVIGMVHLRALPGTPKYKDSIQQIVDKACMEADIYVRNDVDAVLIENMHDIPYVQSKDFQPETVAVMSRVCNEVKRILPPNIPCGVQVLACGNQEALAIAKACHLDFIRVEGFVFSHVADEGFTNAIAGNLLRYRKQIHAEDVLIFTDVKKKHSSHSITADISLVETAKTAEFFLSDGIILTGTSTGVAANPNELRSVKNQIEIPILVLTLRKEDYGSMM